MSKEDPQTDAEMEEAYGPVPESTGPQRGVSGGPESSLYFMSPVQALLLKLRDFMGVTAKADRLPDPTPEQILARLPPDAVEDFLRNRDAMWSGQFANQMPQNLQRQTTKADSAFNMPEVSDNWGDRPRYPMKSWEPEWYHPIKSDSQIASERFPFYYDATGKFPTKGTKPIRNTQSPNQSAYPIPAPDPAEDLVAKEINKGE